MTLLKHPPAPKPKPSLFNVQKRVGVLESSVGYLQSSAAYLHRAFRNNRENPVIGFIRTVGAIWGIGAFLVLVAFLLSSR